MSDDLQEEGTKPRGIRVAIDVSIDCIFGI